MRMGGQRCGRNSQNINKKRDHRNVFSFSVDCVPGLSDILVQDILAVDTFIDRYKGQLAEL